MLFVFIKFAKPHRVTSTFDLKISGSLNSLVKLVSGGFRKPFWSQPLTALGGHLDRCLNI